MGVARSGVSEVWGGRRRRMCIRDRVMSMALRFWVNGQYGVSDFVFYVVVEVFISHAIDDGHVGDFLAPRSFSQLGGEYDPAGIEETGGPQLVVGFAREYSFRSFVL